MTVPSSRVEFVIEGETVDGKKLQRITGSGQGVRLVIGDLGHRHVGCARHRSGPIA